MYFITIWDIAEVFSQKYSAPAHAIMVMSEVSNEDWPGKSEPPSNHIRVSPARTCTL